MQEEPGDDYIRRIAGYIRENEVRLAHAGLGRRRKAHSVPNYSIFNPLGWVGLADSNASQSPVVLSMDTHHLFYMLMRLEALGIDIGTLDVQLDDLSRPLSYIDVGQGKDKSETLSIAESFRSSLSAVSKLSLGSVWWSRTEPRTVEDELKYIYSAFTKLPALSITAPGPKVVTELAHDPPLNNAIPLDSFKFLLSLDCADIDPRALLGWDRLAESLRSLTIKRSGLDNPAHIFLDAVVDDQLRREGDATRSRIRKLGHRASHRGFHSSNLPETVQEESEDDLSEESSSVPVLSRLSPLKWAFLKHLSLADNALTTIPSSMLPPLTSLTHLDLSSNLLVSIPQLSPLYNLTSLNLSDNMIDSVLGIYKKLGQVLVLNLARNRLDSLCGLERLMAIERIDLRNNVIDESAEVGRLAVLPNISEVWIEGNPFVEAEENYRVRCFDYFWKEGKTIMLDGALPGFYERRNRSAPLPEEVSPPRVPVAPYSPPALPVGSAAAASKPHTESQMLSSGSSSNVPSPSIQPLVAKPKKKRNKRIVALDGGESDYRSSEDGGRIRSESRQDAHSKSPPERLSTAQEGSPQSKEEAPIRRSRHSRYRTEVTTPISPSSDAFTSTSPRSGTGGSLGRRTSGTRRNRLSTSMYEPPNEPNDTDSTAKQMRDAEQFRAKIEALRAEMGDNWLQVLSQTQLRSDQSTKR